LQGDDLVAAQRLEKWLEAADDEAAHDLTVDVDLTDAGRPLDLLHRGRADKTDFDSLGRILCDHAPEPRKHAGRCHQ
jgi:hypothetical protein